MRHLIETSLQDATVDALTAAADQLLSSWTEATPAAETWRALDLVFARMPEALAREEDREAALTRLRARLHPHVLQAPCIARSWHKPRGYAGDSGIMDMGYRNLREGVTPLGRMLHQWFCLSHGGTAVRARRRWILLQMMRHGRTYPERWRALSVAGGSAWELRDLLHESFLSRTADITVLDQDPIALEDAEAGYEVAAATYGRRAPIRFVQASIRDLLRGEVAVPEQDFVYSLGLYDYLDDRAATALTRRLHSLLAPGGQLVVGNYLHGTDSQPLIETLMDWHLTYRSPEAIAALATGLEGEVRVEEDCTGTIGFLVLTRP